MPSSALVAWARFSQDLDEQLALREALGEAFLFEPDWRTARWVSLLLGFLEAFRPDEPVTLVFVVDGSSGTLDVATAEKTVQALIERTGRNRTPPILVVGPEALPEIEQSFRATQRIPEDPLRVDAWQSFCGRRYAAALARMKV